MVAAINSHMCWYSGTARLKTTKQCWSMTEWFLGEHSKGQCKVQPGAANVDRFTEAVIKFARQRIVNQFLENLVASMTP